MAPTHHNAPSESDLERLKEKLGADALECATDSSYGKVMAGVRRAAHKLSQPMPLVYIVHTKDEMSWGIDVRIQAILIPKADADTFSAAQIEGIALHELGHEKPGRPRLQDQCDHAASRLAVMQIQTGSRPRGLADVLRFWDALEKEYPLTATAITHNISCFTDFKTRTHQLKALQADKADIALLEVIEELGITVAALAIVPLMYKRAARHAEEYNADAVSVTHATKPKEWLNSLARRFPDETGETRAPANDEEWARLFNECINDETLLKSTIGILMRDTHPRTADRIARGHQIISSLPPR